ncbi:uncharacterized protein LOC129200035 [Grus americana]|uniref:uncharacterized protein LOC129200035 n=1 Tax=Grus americana TaxID=9117 RepID=UPI002407E4C6|nr:uncharacterized protein LOC129200035 [Grus americana]
MEGCCTVAVSLELSSSFPMLLRLSTKEVVAIWDAVSAYILTQMKLDKGVLLTGLGTFAVLQEQLQGKEEAYEVRRPVFQPDIDALQLEELVFPTVVIPGEKAVATLHFPPPRPGEDVCSLLFGKGWEMSGMASKGNVKIQPLNYKWLSRATCFPQHVVAECVRETVRLYSFQLQKGRRLAFVFKDIGVLSCKDDVLCMRFYYNCVTGLERKASRIALLRTRLWMPSAEVSGGATTARGMQAAPAQAFPRFEFLVISRSVAKAFSTWHKKASGKHRISRASQGCPDKLLQRRVKLSLPVLPSQGPGTRQPDMEKKTSASVLPPCPGSSPKTKEAGRQEPFPPARPTAAIPSSEGCKRALQEVWQLSAEWEQVKTRWQERRQQAKAEWAAWEAWAAGEDRQPPQALGTGGPWIPHPPAQPRRKEVNERWRKAENPLPAEEMAAAAQLKRLQPE